MTRIEGETVIARPPEEVFDFVADECNEPSFNPRMVHVERVSDGPVGAGTEFLAISTARGRSVDMVIELTEYDRPRRLGSVTHTATADIRGTLTFEPDPQGTRMHWTSDVQPSGMAARLFAPLIGFLGRRQEAEIWAGLKRCLERPEHSAS